MLGQVDLNLLLVLNSLLKTGSVTDSAHQLGKSQPAISSALAKLRIQLADPLFVRDGQQLKPTDRALELARPLEDIIQRLGDLVTQPGTFDPATTRRSFRVACADFMRDSLFGRMGDFFTQAPSAQIQFEPLTDDSFDRLARGDVHLVVSSEAPSSDQRHQIDSHQAEPLSWGVFCRPNHPYSRRLTYEVWHGAHHVQLDPPRGSKQAATDAVYKERIQRRVAVRVPDFLTGLMVTAQSDFLFTAPTAPHSEQAEKLGLWVMPVPAELALKPVPLFFQMRKTTQDPASGWLKSLLFPEGSEAAPQVGPIRT